jgi:hypothetical protein
MGLCVFHFTIQSRECRVAYKSVPEPAAIHSSCIMLKLDHYGFRNCRFPESMSETKMPLYTDLMLEFFPRNPGKHRTLCRKCGYLSVYSRRCRFRKSYRSQTPQPAAKSPIKYFDISSKTSISHDCRDGSFHLNFSKVKFLVH